MARCMKFDDQDRTALRALDDFTIAPISPDGEVATVKGEMKVEFARLAYDGGSQLYLTITLPSGEEFEVMIARVDLLRAAGIDADGEA
jgi:hypothetical protein